jgi:benzoyl-CoA reductase subunit C
MNYPAGTAGGMLSPKAPWVERYGDLATDPAFPSVRAWKARTGGRAVGYFPVHPPSELIHAAGLLPVGVMGGGTRVEIDHADSRMQSFVCSISRSTLELGLTSRLDCLDGMVFTTICDVARNLSGVWKRNFGGAMMTELLHMPQQSNHEAAIEYLRAEFARFTGRLEALSGQAVTPERLSDSIALFNLGRRRLRELYAARAKNPERVSAAEAYVLARLGCVLPKDEHIRLLDQALADIAARTAKPRDGVRVVLEGSFCEQPPLELLEIIEEAGCQVVDDDLVVGQRWYQGEVPADGPDPMANLARAYVNGSRMTSVRHQGAARRSETMVGRMREARAEGVLFVSAKFCEPALYDFVLCKDVLERTKVPFLSLEFEEKMGAFESARTQVETFVESVLFA